MVKHPVVKKHLEQTTLVTYTWIILQQEDLIPVNKRQSSPTSATEQSSPTTATEQSSPTSVTEKSSPTTATEKSSQSSPTSATEQCSPNFE